MSPRSPTCFRLTPPTLVISGTRNVPLHCYCFMYCSDKYLDVKYFCDWGGHWPPTLLGPAPVQCRLRPLVSAQTINCIMAKLIMIIPQFATLPHCHGTSLPHCVTRTGKVSAAISLVPTFWPLLIHIHTQTHSFQNRNCTLY